MFTRRILFTIALVALGSILILGYSIVTQKDEILSLPEDITIEETLARSLDPEYTLIDVRTAKEVESGYIKGAINIDVKGKDFAEKVQALPRDKKYVLYCVSGNRSTHATEAMKSMGFTSLEHMRDGVVGWTEQGLPLEK